MTPDQAKKPLPSSSSVAFLEEPRTHHEWRYVLKVIKVEYQKGRWKHSLMRCNRLLNAALSPLPLHVACLHFYAALSEEAIARQMHSMSLAKIQTLQHAKSSFEKATSSLPILDTRNVINDSCSPDSVSEADDSVSLEDSVSSIGSPHLVDSVRTKSRELSAPPSPTTDTLKPLPLQISKHVQSGSTSFKEKRAFFEAKLYSSKRTPSISTLPKSPVSEKPSPAPSPSMGPLGACHTPHLKPKTSLYSSIPRVQSLAHERYIKQLQDFAQTLTKHVCSVDEAIAATQEAQANGRRRLIKERKSRSNEDEEEVMDLQTRIARLKAKGWIRERFMPERYQKLCERVLSEL